MNKKIANVLRILFDNKNYLQSSYIEKASEREVELIFTDSEILITIL